jgi:spore coat protein U-like protein
MKIGARLGSIAGLTLLTGAAQAATATSTFQVQLAITAQCLINSTSTIDFGTHGVIQTNLDAAAVDLKIQCTNTTTYNIGLDAGANGGTTTTRLMSAGSSDTVQYKLFSDIGHTTNWGNTIGTDTQSSTGTGAEQTFQIYGRVPIQSTGAPGSYTDTVTVTVTY